MNCIEETNDIMSIFNSIDFEELFKKTDKNWEIMIHPLGNYHLSTISNIYKINIIDKLRFLLDKKYEFHYKEEIIKFIEYPEFVIKSNINKDKYYGIYIHLSYIDNEVIKDIILGNSVVNDTFYFRNMNKVLYFRNILWFNPSIKTFFIMEIRLIPDPTYLDFFPRHSQLRIIN